MTVSRNLGSRLAVCVTAILVAALLGRGLCHAQTELAWFGIGGKSKNSSGASSSSPDANIPADMLERFETLGLEPEPIVRADKATASREEEAQFEARRQYMLGVWLMTRQEFAKAQEAFQLALANEPESVTIRTAVARCLLRQNQVDRCVEMCQQILEKDAHAVEARLLLAEAYEQSGEEKKAIDAYRKGLEDLPESLSLLEPLGNLYLRRGDLNGTIEIFGRIHQRVRKEQRHNLYAMLVLAHFYNLAGQTDKAVGMYREAMQVYADYPKIYYDLIGLLLNLGRKKEALEVCKQGLIRSPDDQTLFGFFDRCAGSREAAINEYRRFADEYDQLSEIQLAWGKRALHPLEDLDGANEAFRRVLMFDGNHPDALMGLGETLQLKGKADEALECFRRATAVLPDSARAFKGLATSYAQNGQWAKAATEMETALTLDPADADTHLKLAFMRERAGDRDAAIAGLEQAARQFQTKEQCAAILERLGETLLEAGKNSEAAEVLSKALDKAPKSLWLYRRLMDACLAADKRKELDDLAVRGRKAFSERPFEFEALVADFYCEKQMRPEAIDALRRAIAINPEIFAAHERLVSQLTAMKRYGEAEAALQEATRRFEDKEPVRLALAKGELLISQKHYDEALALFEDRFKKAAGEGGKDDLSNRLCLLPYYAFLLNKKDRRDEALRLCDETLERKTTDTEPIVNQVLGYVFVDLSAWQKARESFEFLAARAPDNDEYLYQLGAVYDQLKMRDKAEKSLRRAVTLAPNNYQALNHLGYMFAEQGRNLNEAIELIERAIKIKPGESYIIDSLGWAYYQKGELDKAIRLLRQAASTPDADPVILEHLGDAHKKNGDLEKAVETWQASLKRGKDNPVLREKIDQTRNTLRARAEEGKQEKE